MSTIIKGQSFVRIQALPISNTHFDNIWSCIVQNETDKNYDAYFKVKLIEKKKGVVYDVVSHNMVFEAKKEASINTAMIQIKQIIVDKLPNHSQLPAGSYEYIMELVESQTDSKIAIQESVLGVDVSGGIYESLLPVQSKMGNWVNFSGMARLTYEYNPVISNFTQLPTNQYIRLEATPSVSVKGIPISSNILYSTEKFLNTDLNQIDFQFDYNRYKSQLKELILEKIKAMENVGSEKLGELKSIKESYIAEKYPQLGKLKEKLSEAQFKDIESQLKSYTNTQKLIQALDEDGDFQKYKSLAERYNIKNTDDLQQIKGRLSESELKQMEWYLNTQNTYNTLKSKSKEYSPKAELYTQYQKWQKELKAIETVDYKEVLNDSKSLDKVLNRIPGLSAYYKWFNSVRQLGIGASYPHYSDITLSGMRNKGVHIELNKGQYYTAFTRGRIEATNYLGYPIKGMDRNLQGVRMGIGKVEDSHLFFNYIKVQDDFGTKDTISTRPQENMIVGAELQLSLFKNKLWLKSEIAQSFHTLDRTIRDTTGKEDVNTGELPFFRYNTTTHKDKAIHIEIQSRLNNGNTYLKGYYKYVGGGYVSLGVPFLLKDIQRYEGRLTQYFLKKRINISAFIRNDADNVLSNKLATNYNTSIGGELGLNFRKFPSIKIGFAPTHQRTLGSIDTLSSFKANTQMVSLTLAYQYRLSRYVNGVTQINGIGYIGKIGKESYTTQNLNIQQSIQSTSGIGVNIFYTRYQQQLDNTTLSVVEDGIYAGGEGFMRILKNTHIALGYTYTKAKAYPERQVGYIETSYPLLKMSTIRLRLNYAIQDSFHSSTPSVYNSLNNGLGAGVTMLFNW